MNIYNLLNGTGFLNVNKELARKTNLNAAALFGQVLASYQSFKQKGMLTIRDGKQWFFLTEETIEEETTLKRDTQARAIALLVKEGYMNVKRFGLPAKRHFNITQKIFIDLVRDNDELREALVLEGFSTVSQSSDLATSSYRKNTQLENANTHNSTSQIHTTIKKKKEKEKIKKKNIKESIPTNKRKTRAEIVSEIKDAYAGLIDDTIFDLVVVRVTKAKPRRFRDYLTQAVETEIKSGKSETTKTTKTTRKELKPDWLGEQEKESEVEDLEANQKRLNELLGKNKM
ncbi:hypothetical protein [Bacillus toyonensis]|uniref:hypothetical protein n=1 Tax=Bacillus toyonensis TaxID=155322 RepID=UPI00027BEA60|nr:hypothetical protein [Bacillus toyonensis]EJV41764.1 hypothetical protein IEA_05649 [Bacillus toyonensis]